MNINVHGLPQIGPIPSTPGIDKLGRGQSPRDTVAPLFSSLDAARGLINGVLISSIFWAIAIMAFL